MSDVTRTNRKDAIREAKRTIILDAALEVFERDGLEAASMRAIGNAAGYTAAAIYFHFPSKEAIYEELLSRSLDRLIAAVETASDDESAPGQQLEAAALAFFDFYAANPRDLDLGFYLFRGGVQPRGLSREADAALNDKLLQSLAPVALAARNLGATRQVAQSIVADIFAHAVGLLVSEHTGRMKLFGAHPRKLMQDQIGRIVRELNDRQ
ncbi:MAG TPA: helix-turn-helix domain-containing protein [Candidatus Defluviicoccus seviourii]|nr:helix-turn-helix domain-containing protein [Candidatus Defluviicoccus seviourii]